MYYWALLFAALVVSVSSASPQPSAPKDSYYDSAPEEFTLPDRNSSRWRHLSVDITINLGLGSLAAEPSAFNDSELLGEGFIVTDSGSVDSGAFPGSYQLLAAAGIAVLLAVLITVEVYSLYLKRVRSMESGVLRVKSTV